MISVAFILKFIVAAVGAGTPLLFGTVGEISSTGAGSLRGQRITGIGRRRARYRKIHVDAADLCTALQHW